MLQDDLVLRPEAFFLGREGVENRREEFPLLGGHVDLVDPVAGLIFLLRIRGIPDGVQGIHFPGPGLGIIRQVPINPWRPIFPEDSRKAAQMSAPELLQTGVPIMKESQEFLLPGFHRSFARRKAPGDIGDVDRRMPEETQENPCHQSLLFSLLKGAFIDFEILLEHSGNSADDVFGYHHKAPPYRLVSQTLIDERGVPF